ncbi:MAG: dihydrofolate reductase family protein [Chloroflexota bacterium]|nr:dihydrofolate reductase family protein [Chloroflexota bacterium]
MDVAHEPGCDRRHTPRQACNENALSRPRAKPSEPPHSAPPFKPSDPSHAAPPKKVSEPQPPINATPAETGTDARSGGDSVDVKAISLAELEQAYRSLVFPEGQTDRPHVIINMVSSFDGSVTVADPRTGDSSERGLGSSADKRVMQLLRSHADAVLNGAETLRVSRSSPVVANEELRAIRRTKGKPNNPLAIVMTRTGEHLPLERADPKSDFFYSKEFKAVVFVTSAATTSIVERIAATGRSVEMISESPDNIVELLAIARSKYGVNMLVCEGGPSINGALIGHGAADEFFMTFAPTIVGGGKHPVELSVPLDRDRLQSLQLVSSYYLSETGEHFLRYRIHSSRTHTKS